MSKCDVVVIGAGAAGLSAGALLAAEGKSVQVLERSPHLGGRALAVEDEGFTFVFVWCYEPVVLFFWVGF